MFQSKGIGKQFHVLPDIKACLVVVVCRIVQVVIPVKEGLSIVSEIGKYSFLALIQGVESGKYQLAIGVMFGELFAEQTLSHSFVTQVFSE